MLSPRRLLAAAVFMLSATLALAGLDVAWAGPGQPPQAAINTAVAAAGPTTVSAHVLSDQTWTKAGSPYVVSSRLLIRNGATLTIEPGVVVKFMRTGSPVSTSGFQMYGGRLVARGTAVEPVTFTSYYDDEAGGDTDGGSTAPKRGDWMSLDFYDGTGLAPSVLTNVRVKYSGSGGGMCHAGAALSVKETGRLRVSKTDIVGSNGAGIHVAALRPSVGVATVSNVAVRDSLCGFEGYGGVYTDNLVDSSVGQGFRIFSPSRVVMSGNWFANLSDVRGTDLTRLDFDFRNNAVPGGIIALPAFVGQTPKDLSGNWWGPNPTVPGSCHTSGDVEIPATGLTGNAACSSFVAHGAYFTKVLPFSAAPAVPQTGPGADPDAPAPVPAEQMLGGTGGSEYSYPVRGSVGDPVSTALGSFTDARTDAAVPAPGLPLTASRSYNSADATSGLLGRGWRSGYEASLEVQSGEDVAVLHAEDGQQVRFDRQPDGSYAGGPGVTSELTRDGAEWVLRTRAQLTRRFSAAGRLMAITDANANTLALSYDQDGRLVEVSNSGRSLGFEHDSTGALSKVTLADGRFVGHGYTDGLLTSVRDLAGRVTNHEYDDQGRLTKVVDPAGATTMRLAYDPVNGRVSDQWDAAGNRSRFAWDAAEEISTMTDPRGGVHVDDYDGNLLVRRTTPDGATWRYAYDAKLQLTGVEGPRGFFQEMSYNAAGDLISVESPSGLVRTSFDAEHRPVSSVNARNVEVGYRYDGAGNLTRIQRPNPASPGNTLDTVFGYTPRGELATTQQPGGGVTSYAYTQQGDLSSVTSPSGATRRFDYDAVGRRTATVSARGTETGATAAEFTSRVGYADDDQVATSTDPLGRRTGYDYDPVGRLAKVTDPLGRETAFGYDTAGRVSTITGPDPQAGPVEFSYDANSNRATVKDTAGRVVSYAYDLMNRPTKTTTPLGSTSYGYDLAGNVTKLTDATGAITAMSYDGANRLTRIDYPGTTADVTYQYNVNGSRTAMVDGAGTVSYSYDALERVTRVVRGSAAFGYAYDADGNLTKLTYPDGTVVSYGYDADQRLSTVRRNSDLLASYGYDADAEVVSLVRGNGTQAAYDYDSAGQLVSVEDSGAGAALVDEDYVYDLAGNLTGIDSGGGPRARFQYDAANRLVAACYEAQTCAQADDYVKWGYDAADNRTSETRPGSSTTYAYDAATGLLKSSDSGAGVTSYVHNALGQLTSSTGPDGVVRTLRYSAAGRLVSSVSGGETVTHSYDGDGRRLSTVAGGVTGRFVWEPVTHQLVAETDANNVVTRRYTAGLGLVGVEAPDAAGAMALDYFHTDRLGSVRAVTSSSADLQRVYEWEPYGVARSSVQVDPGARANPIGWLGEYGAVPQAGVSGSLVHLRARDYDPVLGRFSAPDPASAVSFSGTGSYAAGNPLRLVDPYGLWPSLGGIWGGVSRAAPVIATVAGAGALVPSPLSPFLGGVALAAGAVTTVDSAVDAYQVCSGAEKGSCAGEVTRGAVGIAAGAVGGHLLRRALAAKTETSLVKYEEWPANNGFFGGFEKDSVLQPGTRIDRYGSNRGSFVSPEGTPFKSRGLPSSRADDPYSSFTVQKPITVRGGIAAPWMDSPGGGVQYLLPRSVQDLLDGGFLG